MASHKPMGRLDLAGLPPPVRRSNRDNAGEQRDARRDPQALEWASPVCRKAQNVHTS